MKQKIAKNFSKAAKHYDVNAELQNYCAENLVKLAGEYMKPNARILDIGSGTGFIAKHLKQNVINLDIALDMCRTSMELGHSICADFENLPIKDNSFDCVFSASAIQWNDNLKDIFKGVNKTLKNGGYFFISTFGHNTLRELKDVYRKNGLKRTIMDFIEIEELNENLMEAGFEVERYKAEKKKLPDKDIMGLFDRMRVIGAGSSGDSNKFTKKLLSKMNDDYLKNPGEDNISSTWEILYFICKKSS